MNKFPFRTFLWEATDGSRIITESLGGNSEQLLKQYAHKPTLGNALMAQALYMKESWIPSQHKEN